MGGGFFDSGDMALDVDGQAEGLAFYLESADDVAAHTDDEIGRELDAALRLEKLDAAHEADDGATEDIVVGVGVTDRFEEGVAFGFFEDEAHVGADELVERGFARLPTPLGLTDEAEGLAGR